MKEEDYMNKAFEIAMSAFPMECPVGCIITYENKIIASAHNLTNKLNNCLEHAELICLQTLSESGFTNFRNINVFITSEPCIMCADYLKQLNVKNIFFGEKNYRFGIHLIVKYIEENKHKIAFKKINISPDYLNLLKQFYSQINLKAPEEIRKTKNKKKHSCINKIINY